MKGIMVLAMCSSEHGLSRPFFVQAGLKVDAAVFKQIMQESVIPQICSWYGQPNESSPIHLLMDNAPGHNAKSLKTWMSRSVPWLKVEAWPPCSPDMSPLDFAAWSSVVSRMGPTSDLMELRGEIMQAFEAQDQELAKRWCTETFPRRLEQLLLMEGGHFEHRLRRPAAAVADGSPAPSTPGTPGSDDLAHQEDSEAAPGTPGTWLEDSEVE